MGGEAVALWLGVLVVGLTAIAGTYLYLNPPDYGFVDENRALLETLPVYPGAHFLRESSARYGDPLPGFTTTRTFRVSGRADVVGFYARKLDGRCVRVALPGSFRCGRARVVVHVRGGLYDLTADSR